MVFNSFYGDKVFEVPEYPGTSATVPGQAPTLEQLVQASIQGVPLPLCGTPMFDDSDESGEARISSNSIPIEDIVTSARNGDFEENTEPNDEKAKDEPASKAGEDDNAEDIKS